MKRIYHPWNKWEDFQNGFYSTVPAKEKKNAIELCGAFFKDLNSFELALKVIMISWKHSCEHNLTNESLNKIAYLGQAACALVFKYPSDIGSAGYNLLNEEEKKAADAMALKYLNLWLSQHGEQDVATKNL